MRGGAPQPITMSDGARLWPRAVIEGDQSVLATRIVRGARGVGGASRTRRNALKTSCNGSAPCILGKFPFKLKGKNESPPINFLQYPTCSGIPLQLQRGRCICNDKAFFCSKKQYRCKNGDRAQSCQKIFTSPQNPEAENCRFQRRIAAILNPKNGAVARCSMKFFFAKKLLQRHSK